MKYLIWGAGERGKRLFHHIGSENVVAFIDIDKAKIGQECQGKEIISFEEYKRKYSEYYIIISCLQEEEVIKFLEDNGIYRYFIMSECPGEFQESNSRTLLKQYICNEIKKETEYVIYGCTLYTFILNDWIEKTKGKRAVIIPHKGINKKIYNLMKKDYSKDNFIDLDNISDCNIKNILVTYEKDIDFIKKQLGEFYKINNVYDCSDRIEEYHNPRIDKFKNIHSGKRCFIVATGPSLRMDDLEMLKANNEICISMNSIWRCFDKVEWRPSYYVAEDPRAYKGFGNILENMDIDYLFLADTDKEYWLQSHGKNILKYHFVFEFCEKKYPKFSEIFSRKCYGGATVTYSCIQLAIYMGFKEIYLLGVDFSHGKEAENEKYQHFYKEEKLIARGFNKIVYLAYQSAKKYADSHGIRILNATRGGKLEVFERVDLDKVLSREVDRYEL